MNTNFEYITSLQYKVKTLTAQTKAFEPGKNIKEFRFTIMTKRIATMAVTTRSV